MGEIADKVFLVTGANTGIGRVTAETLAKRGAKVWVASRFPPPPDETVVPVVDAIRRAGGRAEFLPLDLSDLASVRACAAQFLATGERLDVLVNNAGLAGRRGLTKDGFEITFGTNHLGPFLLTLLLLPRLQERAHARIVNVSGQGHYDPKGIDFGALRSPAPGVTGYPAYTVSKLCNVLFTKELARGRAGPNVHSYALHPGVVATGIWRNVPWPIRPLVTRFMASSEDGAKTSLYCASSDHVASDNGLYYDACKVKRPSRVAQDERLARELWERSLAWCGLDAAPAGVGR